MKKQNIIILSFAMAMVLAGCSNVEAKQGNNTSIESKTTITTTEASTTTPTVVTPSEMSSTSFSESIPVISDEITTTTTEKETDTSTSTEKNESSTTLETTTTVSTTTTKKPTVTTTTTKKATTSTTTTKKSTTTTKKVTTTAKKTTTTATTTKKTTTTTSKVETLTQADVDKMVKELQIYADEIFENKSGYSPKSEEWVVQKGSIENWYWGTYEEHLLYKTPNNSSWDAPVQVSVSKDYSTVYAWIKDEIETDYLTSPNCHVVVYVMWCPDGFCWEGEQYTDFPCWTFFCLR